MASEAGARATQVEVTIRLLPDDVVLRVKPGEAILDTMRRHGYSHRFGCRRGGCGVCRIDLVEGTTVDAAVVAESVLGATERDQGVRLSCRAVPTADVVLRVRDDDRLRCVSSFLARYAAKTSPPPEGAVT